MRRNATIYQGSDGKYYGNIDVWNRFETGVWDPCCWDEESGTEWVRTEENELLVLTPVLEDDLPDWVEVEYVAIGTTVDPLPSTETAKPTLSEVNGVRVTNRGK